MQMVMDVNCIVVLQVLWYLVARWNFENAKEFSVENNVLFIGGKNC